MAGWLPRAGHWPLVGVRLVGLRARAPGSSAVQPLPLLPAPHRPPSLVSPSTTRPPPGFLAASTYQALYTLPHWDRLVGRHLAAAAARGAPPRRVAGLLALFGCLFNGHMLAQALVFRAEGAIGVGLVNACRGAAITVVVSLLFCDPARAHLCLTRQTALSALVTTAGGLVYVLANGMRRPPAPAPAAAKVEAAPAPAAAATAPAVDPERPRRVTRRRAAASKAKDA